MEEYIEYFKKNICCYCSNKDCEKGIVIVAKKREVKMKCKDYIKKVEINAE